ncbi:MAG: SDR family oxidoreductase [Calditrichaceae bacterium]|nr:SDR family oxidoreductase [Calditrichaceae bacterium]
MRVLFIGGTGIISTACAELCIERGIELYLLNRGKSARPIPANAKPLIADYRNPAEVSAAIGNLQFDAVVDWIAFVPEQVQYDIDFFKDRTRQYVFISSASAYQTPPRKLPVTELTPLENPVWQYSRDKIACENLLKRVYKFDQFPATIVRPSHTYDRTTLPFQEHYTMIERMRKGKKVILHGDGTSLWVLTHSKDFAKGFVGLLGNEAAIGEVFHITSDELLSWNQIVQYFADAIGVKPDIVHVPSEVIARYHKDWGDSLLGDKMHSMIFDNSKIKKFVPDFEATIPFSEGVKEIITWYDADPSRQQVNSQMDVLIDKIISDYA